MHRQVGGAGQQGPVLGRWHGEAEHVKGVVAREQHAGKCTERRHGAIAGTGLVHGLCGKAGLGDMAQRGGEALAPGAQGRVDRPLRPFSMRQVPSHLSPGIPIG